MGNEGSTDSNPEASRQPTGATLSENSPGHTPRPRRRGTDVRKMSDESKMKMNREESEDGLWAPSAKTSSEFDDDFFEKFCGEIDHVLEGHREALQPSQKKKPTSTMVDKTFPDEASLIRQTGPILDPRFKQQEHEGQHLEMDSYPPRDPRSHPQTHQWQQDQQHMSQLPKPHRQNKRHTLVPSLSPSRPLAARSSEEPVSIWKRPEDLARREKILRERFEDTWFPTWAELEASRKESIRQMRQHSDLEANLQKDADLDDPLLQEKDGFDVSKFKAANKKRYGQKVERLLPATYKGYNASLSRQGTVPSLHRASVSSTLSGSGMSASDKLRSPPSAVSKEPTYNPSEEALLDFIEKEFS